MSQNALYFPFDYIAKNERLLPETGTIYLDLTKVIVIGPLQVPVYDTGRAGFFKMLGYFLEYEGNTYGSVSITPGQVTTLLTQCQCGSQGGGRIHTRQHARQFN